ncbi:protein JINGUBANG [Neltuma alba]|uniref:protein JINGUBANG n=1 Tax=Neltuma alba TaxID=207710 RepID=UPI0010A45FFB|nr:protein JINGUBANG [Prosopis alba]
MGLLCCHTEEQEQRSPDNSDHLHSESSNASSLSSQPSLPSVPSLTPPALQSHQTQNLSQSHHQLITTLTSTPSSPVFSITLHGKFLYTGSFNSEIRAWSRGPGFSSNPHGDVVSANNGAVKSLVVSGDKLFSAHQDHKIRVWKIQPDDPNLRFKPVATLPTVGDRFCKLLSAKNYVQVRRHKKCTWVHHVDTVSSLALSEDGSLLYSASWDRTFKIWRTSDFKCLESVRAHEDAINALVVSSDGVVYTGSADKKIKMWKKKEGEKNHSLLGTLEKHKSAVNALALSTDGSVLYSGACDRSILVWEKDGNDEGKMVLVGALRGHTRAILSLVAMEDLVCSGSADNSVRIWRRGLDKSYTCLAVLEGHKKPVKCLAMAVDSNQSNNNNNNGGSDSSSTSYLVYSGGLDCNIKVWKVQVPLF